MEKLAADSDSESNAAKPKKLRASRVRVIGC
jgi:hypothetical protein